MQDFQRLLKTLGDAYTNKVVVSVDLLMLENTYLNTHSYYPIEVKIICSDCQKPLHRVQLFWISLRLGLQKSSAYFTLKLFVLLWSVLHCFLCKWRPKSTVLLQCKNVSSSKSNILSLSIMFVTISSKAVAFAKQNSHFFLFSGST